MYNKARKAVKKRYVAKSGGRKATGGIRVAKMAKDIMYLKSVLNPEKKFYQLYETDKKVAQVGYDTASPPNQVDGRFFSDVTPTPTQGVTNEQRNGASIKLHSSVWHFQFAQQSACISNMKVCLEIWAIEKEPYTGFNWFNDHWKPNPFITGLDIRDYNAQTDPNNYMKGRCVARRTFTMLADNLGSEKYVKDIKLPVLYNKGKGRHIRFNNNNQTVENGQLYLVVRTDRGNYGGTPSTLTGIPEVAPNTGLTFSYNCLNYFYDN